MHVVPKMHLEHHVKSMKSMEKMMKTMEKTILWSDPLTPVLRLEKKGCFACDV
jgi:hypothetical protein